MSQFRCCEHSSYVLLFILSNERRTLCSMLVGGEGGVTWKANIRHRILHCMITMGLLTQRSNLVQDYDWGDINSEAK